MKMKKRIVAAACLVAVCVSLMALPISASAAANKQDEQAGTRWLNTSVVTLGITFSSGTAYCDGVIIGQQNVSKIVATFTLLKKGSNGINTAHYSWAAVTVKDFWLSFSGNCSVSTGQYRLQVSAVVTNTSGVSETVTTYSDRECK